MISKEADTLETQSQRHEAARPFLRNLAKLAPPVITLFGIEQHVLDLLDFRLDVLERLAALQDNPDAIDERADAVAELDSCDLELRKLAGLEANKVDKCANLIRALYAVVAHRKDERDRHNRAAKRAEAQAEYVETVVMEALTLADRTRFESEHNTLRMQRNPARVEITDGAAVQDRFLKITLETTVDRWKQMRQSQPDLIQYFAEKERTFKLSDMATVIRAATNAETVAEAKLTGAELRDELKKIPRVKGARLVHDTHLRVE